MTLKRYTLSVASPEDWANIHGALIVDSNEDGIDRLWWQQKDSVGTSGELGLYNMDQSIIKKFTPDFGQEIRMDFIIGSIP